MLVVETGTEVDVGMGPVNQSNKGGSSLQVGEGGDDEDYEREAPPPSDIDHCDWVGLRCSIHDIINSDDICLHSSLPHSTSEFFTVQYFLIVRVVVHPHVFHKWSG